MVDNTFTAGIKVTTARVEQRLHQYIFKDDYGYNFMNMENFEQVTLQEKMVPFADLMKEGQEVTILFHAETETPLTAELPTYVELTITYTEPGIKVTLPPTPQNQPRLKPVPPSRCRSSLAKTKK